MKIVGLAVAVLGMIGLSTQASATLTCVECPAPTATVTIGTAAPINVPVVTSGGVFSITGFTTTIPGVGTARIDTLLMNPDPFIVFGVGATNLSPTPLVFAFAFTEPIGIPGNAIDASASIGYSLSDGAGNGVTLTAFDVGGKVLIANDFFPPTNKGVNVGPTSTGGVAPNCGPLVGGTSVCGPFAATNTFAQPAVPFVIMGATVSFVLSGNDGAGLSGRVEQVVHTPEPATLLLMGSALAGLGAWRRYRASR
ncbi:MAG TPA: PEP-CTERM sorting domain-containing protein [Nitrospirales bacterium]